MRAIRVVVPRLDYNKLPMVLTVSHGDGLADQIKFAESMFAIGLPGGRELTMTVVEVVA